MSVEPLDAELYLPIVMAALEEDLRDIGDLTARATIHPESVSEAHLVVREPGVVSGLDVAASAFACFDDAIEMNSSAADGERLDEGTIVAVFKGATRGLLTAERTALNLFGRMSGVATATARFVDAVAGTGARITDTRKTMPGLRVLDKYAVRCGGGVNHRMGLHDAAMVKDNHLTSVSIHHAVAALRAEHGPDLPIVVEVDRFDQIDEVLSTEADRILLDNMSVEELRRAVEHIDRRIATEASGGVTLETVRAIAETGVDLISVGWITHSAPQLDVALDFVEP